VAVEVGAAAAEMGVAAVEAAVEAVVLQEVAGAAGLWPGPAPLSPVAVEGVETVAATALSRQAPGRQGSLWT
jgi:hypothetical protein